MKYIIYICLLSFNAFSNPIENAMIDDSKFDSFAKAKLSEFDASVKKGLELQKESKFKFTYKEKTDPMDKSLRSSAFIKSKDAYIEVYCDDVSVKTSVLFDKNLSIKTDEYGYPYGRYRINEEVHDKREVIGSLSKDPDIHNKFIRHSFLLFKFDHKRYQTQENNSSYLYGNVYPEEYIKNKNNKWIPKIHLINSSGSFDVSEFLTGKQFGLNQDEKKIVSDFVTKYTRTFQNCETSSNIHDCKVDLRKKGVPLPPSKVVFKDLKYDYAYEIKTSKGPFYFEVNPFDPALQKLFRSKSCKPYSTTRKFLI